MEAASLKSSLHVVVALLRGGHVALSAGINTIRIVIHWLKVVISEVISVVIFIVSTTMAVATF